MMFLRPSHSAFLCGLALLGACGGTPAPVDAPMPVDIGPGVDAPRDAPANDTPMIVDAPAPMDTPPQPGDNCTMPGAITLTAGMAMIDGTTLGFNNDHEPGQCAGVNSAGPDRAYTITIPAGQRLTATVHPTEAAFDPGIYLIASPAANCDAAPPVCLASNDAGGDGADDLIMYDNTGATDVEAFIIIDGFRPDGGPYTLNVAVAAIP